MKLNNKTRYSIAVIVTFTVVGTLKSNITGLRNFKYVIFAFLLR